MTDIDQSAPTNQPAEPTAEELTEQKAVRLAKRARLIESGAQAYPVSVPVTTTIAAVTTIVTSRAASLRR